MAESAPSYFSGLQPSVIFLSRMNRQGLENGLLQLVLKTHTI